MKEVIVIRHGDKAGDNLTAEGTAACKDLAQRVGSFKLAIASERHRAIQTAELVSGLPVRVDARANVPAFPDAKLDKLMDAQVTYVLGIIGAIWEDRSLVEDARLAGVTLKNLVTDVMNSLGNGERALIVSHDGTMALWLA